MQPIPEEAILKAAQNILFALKILHARGIMHRDLKAANIFRINGTFKLGDLNVSKIMQNSLAYTQTGTPYYASPEVWRDEPYDTKSDIWSFGCILYEMATLNPPFQGNDMDQLFKNIQNKQITPISKIYSQNLWNFIELCLKKSPLHRPTAL